MPLGILRMSCCQRAWEGEGEQRAALMEETKPNEKKASVLFAALRSAELINIISLFLLLVFFGTGGVGG